MDKTFNNKFVKWFNNNKDKNILFEKLNNAITNDIKNMYSTIEDLLKLLDVKGANILLSIVINKNNEIFYLNDFEEFKDILLKNSLDKYQGPKKN